jgi:hypothetical protein
VYKLTTTHLTYFFNAQKQEVARSLNGSRFKMEHTAPIVWNDSDFALYASQGFKLETHHD